MCTWGIVTLVVVSRSHTQFHVLKNHWSAYVHTSTRAANLTIFTCEVTNLLPSVQLVHTQLTCAYVQLYHTHTKIFINSLYTNCYLWDLFFMDIWKYMSLHVTLKIFTKHISNLLRNVRTLFYYLFIFCIIYVDNRFSFDISYLTLELTLISIVQAAQLHIIKLYINKRIQLFWLQGNNLMTYITYAFLSLPFYDLLDW